MKDDDFAVVCEKYFESEFQKENILELDAIQGQEIQSVKLDNHLIESVPSSSALFPIEKIQLYALKHMLT